MKPAPFGYAVAQNRTHAIEILQREGPDARPLAGGQSLVPMMNFRLARPSFLVDLNGCKDLSFVREKADGLHIGAMVRQREAELDPLAARCCPLIPLALSVAGSVPIRSRGTVGGSLANGYPLADLISVALALEASMIVLGPAGERSIPSEEFFVDGMMTAIETGELLIETVFPIATPESRYVYRRRGSKGGEASVIVCASAEADATGGLSKLRIVGAGISSKPIRLRHLESAACGMQASNDLHDAFLADLETRQFVEPDDEMAFAEDQAELLVGVCLEELRRAPVEAGGR